MIDLLLAELKQHRVLLKTDSRLPNVCALVAGEPVRGSWWAHPKSHDIFRALTELAAHRDVLTAKLVSGKDTFIHRNLWAAFLAVALRREPWQLQSLDRAAKALLRQVDEEGQIQTSGAAATALERALLVCSRQVHTAAGSHARILTNWRSWMTEAGVAGIDLPPVEGRREIEAVIARLNAGYAGRGRLPWTPSFPDRPSGR